MPSKRLASRKSPVKSPMPEHAAAPDADAGSARKSDRKRKAREFPDMGGGGGKTPLPSQRVWTDDDAVALLRCAVEFRSRTGAVPSASTMAAFFPSVKPSLPPQITQEQVYNKLRHLRHRHLHGAAATHGPLAQGLSDRLWGSDPNDTSKEEVNGGVAENVNNGLNEVEKIEGYDVSKDYPFLVEAMGQNCKLRGMSTSMMLEGLRLVNPAKVKALEKKWSRHWHLDMKLKSKRCELLGKLYGILSSGGEGSSQ